MSNNSNEVIILVGPIVKSNSNNKSKCAKQDDDEELGAVEQQDDSPRDVQADLSMSSTAQSKPTGGGFFQGWQSSTGVRRLHSSRKRRDEKVVGLKHYGLENPVRQQLHHPAASFDNTGGRFAVEAKEEEVRRSATRNPFVLCCLANVAALKVMVYYLSKCRMCD